jgi:hypothetical protein
MGNENKNNGVQEEIVSRRKRKSKPTHDVGQKEKQGEVLNSQNF